MFEYRDISFSVKDQSKINWSYFYGMMIQNLLDVDLDDLAAIPMGLPGSNWKYLEYLEALWHRVPKPTTWQLAHDLSTQTERNPRCLILRYLEYH